MATSNQMCYAWCTQICSSLHITDEVTNIKPLALTLAILLFLSPICALAQAAPADDFNDNQSALFEAVCWNMDFPKNAQVLQATEYLCKIDDMQLHLLLVQATQNETVFSIQDNGSTLMLIDLDSDTTITYTNCVWPESSEIATKEDAMNMLFSCWDSYTRGYNPSIFADHEITFPLSAEEIQGINAALAATFTKPE